MSRQIIQNALQTPYVLLEHGMESLDTDVYTLGLFLEQSECRDKMFKVLQYACKALALIIAHFFPHLKKQYDIHERLLLLDFHTGICRKYLRTFAFLPLWRFALNVLLRSDDAKILKFGALGRLLGLSGYFFFDNVLLAIKLRILDGWSTHFLQRVSLGCQLVNQVSSFFVNLHNLNGVNYEFQILTEQLDQKAGGGAKKKVGELKNGEKKNGEKSKRRIKREDSEEGMLSFEDRQTLHEQFNVLIQKRWDLMYQLLKNMSEGTLAANVVFQLHLPDFFTVFLDLINAYLSTKEVWLRLKAKARAEKGEKAKQAEVLGRVSELYARGPLEKHLKHRSMSFPVRPVTKKL